MVSDMMRDYIKSVSFMIYKDDQLLRPCESLAEALYFADQYLISNDVELDIIQRTTDGNVLLMTVSHPWDKVVHIAEYSGMRDDVSLCCNGSSSMQSIPR